MSSFNYNLAQIRGVAFDVDGVLSPTLIPMNSDGVPQRMANLRDGFALQWAVKQGLKISIITGGISDAVALRFGMLGIKDIFQNVGQKLPVLQKWMEDNGLQPEEVAYVGDDIPDVAAMCSVGLAVAPSDAAHEALEVATGVTRAAGGHGVARELLEQILRAKGLWPESSEANGK